MNNAILIAVGVAAYLYFSSSNGGGPTATAPAAGTTPNGIAIGEHNPAEPTYGGGGDPQYLGGPGYLGGGQPVAYTGGPRDPFYDPFTGGWWNGPTYAEQYPVGPGVISV